MERNPTHCRELGRIRFGRVSLLGVTLAALLMGGCGGRSVPTSAHRMVPSTPETSLARQQAVDFLTQMTGNDYALYRANAIEGLQGISPQGDEAARIGLSDENLGVRFAAAMVVGLEKMEAAVPLTHALLNDPDPSVQAAAMFAQARNGHDVNLTPLGLMLDDGDLRTRANVAVILGELGNPQAIPMLREALKVETPHATIQENKIAQLQMAEALVKLGDESAVSRIRGHLYSRNPNEGGVTAFAAQILGRIGAKRYQGDLEQMVYGEDVYRNSAEVRLAAIGSLAQMGGTPELAMVMEYFGPGYDSLPDPGRSAIRAQAAYTLGFMGPDAILHLSGLLNDPSLDVQTRIQAAAAILNIVG